MPVIDHHNVLFGVLLADKQLDLMINGSLILDIFLFPRLNALKLHPASHTSITKLNLKWINSKGAEDLCRLLQKEWRSCKPLLINLYYVPIIFVPSCFMMSNLCYLIEFMDILHYKVYFSSHSFCILCVGKMRGCWCLIVCLFIFQIKNKNEKRMEDVSAHNSNSKSE